MEIQRKEKEGQGLENNRKEETQEEIKKELEKRRKR